MGFLGFFENRDKFSEKVIDDVVQRMEIDVAKFGILLVLAFGPKKAAERFMNKFSYDLEKEGMEFKNNAKNEIRKEISNKLETIDKTVFTKDILLNDREKFVRDTQILVETIDEMILGDIPNTDILITEEELLATIDGFNDVLYNADKIIDDAYRSGKINPGPGELGTWMGFTNEMRGSLQELKNLLGVKISKEDELKAKGIEKNSLSDDQE